jgi:spectinomycin phosphotransferase
MLEKPDLPDEKIIACLRHEYGLPPVQVAFLPLGADQNTAVYRAVAEDETTYFVKLRNGFFDEISVALPRFLSDQGIAQIIAPLATKTGELWAGQDSFKLMLYPFVEGKSAYEVALTERHWLELGAALRRIHTVAVPAALMQSIPRETFTPLWRQTVRKFLDLIEDNPWDDPVAQQVVARLKAKRGEIIDLVARAERLALALRDRPLELVLCHSDLHAGNVLIDAGGALYIVDWDNPILAPKERDLMYAGAGLMGNWRTPQDEETLFYRGYGPTQVDPIALAYYRYERIVQDIAVYCEQLLLTNEGGEDREQSLRYLMSNFLPNNTIEIARRSDC